MSKRNLFLLLSVLVLFLIGTYIQATVYNIPVTITGPLDASGSSRSAPAKVTTSSPGTCTIGDVIFRSDATAGQNLFYCTTTNNFTQQLNSGTATGGGITMYSATGLTVTANTYYIPLGGGGALSTTETNVDIDAPAAATITNMYVQLSVALGMGNSGVFTMRKNAASQSVTCTISGASATNCSDTTHSFAVSQGDLLTIQLVTTGTIVVTPNILIAAQFGNITATGTVNSGTSGQCGYYASTGTAISGQTCGPVLTAPSGSTWTNLNTGSMSLAPTYTSSSYWEMGSRANNGNVFEGLLNSTSFPSAPYTRTFRIIPTISQNNGNGNNGTVMVCWGDGTKHFCFQPQNGLALSTSNPTGFFVNYGVEWSNNTTETANAACLPTGLDANAGIAMGVPIWVQLTDDNTNWIMKWSQEAFPTHYITSCQIAHNTFLTATQFEVGVNSGGGRTQHLIFDSFQ